VVHQLNIGLREATLVAATRVRGQAFGHASQTGQNERSCPVTGTTACPVPLTAGVISCSEFWVARSST
jgi:hypothetical protein